MTDIQLSLSGRSKLNFIYFRFYPLKVVKMRGNMMMEENLNMDGGTIKEGVSRMEVEERNNFMESNYQVNFDDISSEEEEEGNTAHSPPPAHPPWQLFANPEKNLSTEKDDLENFDFDNVTVTNLKMWIKVGGKRNLLEEEELSERKRRRRGDEEVGSIEQCNDFDIESIDEADISNCYRDLVKADCKICGGAFELDLLNSHLVQHGMDVDDYIRAYINPSIIRNLEPESNGRRLLSFLGAPLSSLKYHRCHICEQIFLFTKTRLREHLAGHKIPLRDYERKGFVYLAAPKKEMESRNLSEDDAIFSNDYEDECLTVCSICNRSSNPKIFITVNTLQLFSSSLTF